MKKLLILVGIICVVIVCQSCNSAHKACGAYAKHESKTQPDYKDVQ